MADVAATLAPQISALDRAAAELRSSCAGPAADALSRLRGDIAALQFHLTSREDAPFLLAVLGGTGTGKSTLVNRLLDATVTATSFRRTFTQGAVAVAKDESALPAGWMGVPHQPAGQLPARGQSGGLAVVEGEHPMLQSLVVVDTPDLDGDQPAHHTEADRAFRWAQGVLFLVTPEKYQMTELLPYFRLARRYALPAVFVMNKCEELAVLEDFAGQLRQRDWPDAAVFAVPRDDAAFEPPPGQGLADLRQAMASLRKAEPEQRSAAIGHRCADLVDRVKDQVIAPLRRDRRQVDEMLAALSAMETPQAGIDVGPLTTQLQRRLQEQSVLYLMGPQRILDRARQVPGFLLRLPRLAWKSLVRGEDAQWTLSPPTAAGANPDVPDFHALLVDQFAIVQSRVDDVLRSSPAIEKWMGDAGYGQTRIDTASAGAIANEELAELRTWLERKWHGTPRDTAVIQRLMKYLPGGKKLTEWSEAAPYLLAIIVATHHAFFGPIDLMIIGGWTIATWLGEKISNEVTARTRQTNRRIAQRFERLAHEQIQRTAEWLARQAPPPAALDKLERLADEIAAASSV